MIREWKSIENGPSLQLKSSKKRVFLNKREKEEEKNEKKCEKCN